jgi:hypothetical protein
MEPFTNEQLKAVKMYYFGCVERAGHFMFDISLHQAWRHSDCPWNPDKGEVDGKLQPHLPDCNKRVYCRCGSLPQGQALVHHKEGWTALSFWDRSVDSRGGCNSNFFANGTFDFDTMVMLAKHFFPTIWNRYMFEVVESKV